jgi:Asp-tRNA(Asn)/Glu-tRNA(Gln) amidotransferase A subunit family amidase
VIVKDNYETIDMPTTAGSLSLKGMMTGKDAFIVKRLRDACAEMIAKSNMAEFAFSPYETVNSILPGYSRNPYDTSRVTAGSSGGTAAAVAANFGAVGLGTDTGNSIRGPSAHQALVGIRSTMGLTSRAGVVPLSMAADVTGPMTRTVADAVAVLQVIAGDDPDDAVTAASRGHVAADYASALQRDGLRGARVGVLHQAYDTPTTDGEVVDVFKSALAELRRLGAEVIDPVAVEGLDAMRRGGAACSQFKYDLNRYLSGLGDKAPLHSLEEIIRSRRFHPSIQARLESSQTSDDVPGETPGCKSRDEFRAKLREAVLKVLDDQRLDALVYPTWSNPPRLIGDLNTPHGDNNQLFSPSTGFPAVTVPMGYTRGGTLPAGLQFFGRPWTEAALIRLAYAYEQGTHHRHPPASTPPLP